MDDKLVDPSTLIADEIYVHEDDRDCKESEVELIIAATSVSSSCESVALHLSIAYDESSREIAIGNIFVAFLHSIL